MYILDAHTHVRVDFEDSPQNNIYGVAFAGVEDYLAAFEQNGVSAMWAFASAGFRRESVSRVENEGLAKLGQRYPQKIFPFATVNPALPEERLAEELSYALDQLGLVGLKFHPLCQGVSLSNPGFEVVAEIAIRKGVPVVFHDGSPEYCSATQVLCYAKRHPKLTVISGHGGLRDQWYDYSEYARETENLLICLSGPTQWGMQRLYDRLGPERLLFGSDGGLGTPAITSAYLRRIERLKAPQTHKEMILGQNAKSIVNR